MDLASAYIIAYSLAYFQTSIDVDKPFLYKDTPTPDRLIIVVLGLGLLLAALTKLWPIVLAMGIFEGWSAQRQWWHMTLWDIRGVRGISSIHQIAMATTNLVCSVALFSLLEWH